MKLENWVGSLEQSGEISAIGFRYHLTFLAFGSVVLKHRVYITKVILLLMTRLSGQTLRWATYNNEETKENSPS